MTTRTPSRPPSTPDESVIRWLLDSDPSIRWQTLRDLTRASGVNDARDTFGDTAVDTAVDSAVNAAVDAAVDTDRAIDAERAKVPTEGWGASLLAAQGPDGSWGADTRNPEWVTMKALLLLRGMGLDPTSEAARRAVALVRNHVRWRGVLPQDAAWHDRPLFAGEVEPCINGRVVTAGAYFDEDIAGIVDRLLGEQLSDGGWNCEQERGSVRGSFHTTICVLEGLLEYERSAGSTPAVTSARERGHEYLLERRLLRRLSSGERIDDAWTHLSYPCGYHYDVLRALDYLRAAAVVPDQRWSEAVDLVASKQNADGRWPMEHRHPEELEAEPGLAEGQPSRWNTLRALRVLRWVADHG